MNIFIKTLAVASLALAAAGSSAQAGVIGFGTNIYPFIPNATERLVPLTKNGGLTVNFTTRVHNALVVVTYNGECAVNSNHRGDPLVVRLVVDGVSTPPVALCSALADPASATALITTVSHQTAIRVPMAGTHSVRVYASVYPGAVYGFLDDSSIVIED
jgi:hypothetical protein